MTRVATIADVPADLDVAVVELGTNDVGKTLPWVLRRQYGELLGRICNSSPKVDLICLGVWRAPLFAWVYDRVIRKQCLAVGGRFVGLSDLYGDRRLRGPAGRETFRGISDDFHPNDAGHRAIADRILGLLR